MERFFTQHSVLRDRDADELGGRARSDSEASSASSDEREVSVRSVHDATGPWRQSPVDSGDWGQPGNGARAAGRKPRDFRARFTGPKGVLSDYKAHKRSVRDERARKELERRAVLARIAKGATAAAVGASGDPAAGSQLDSGESGGEADDDCDCDSDCDCADGLVDAAFLRRYQQQRLQELATAATAARRPVFGSLRVVSPAEFVAVVDDEHADAQRVLLVHLFHPENYACTLLNTHLAAVAQQLPHVQIVAMVAEDADESIARGDLPVLLVYRGRQLDETVVGVARALDGEFTAARVLRFVQERLAALYGMRASVSA